MADVTRLTAAGAGGVAVLRIVGERAHAALAALTAGRTVAPGAVRLVRLRAERVPAEALPAGPPAGLTTGPAPAAEDLDEALLVGLPPRAGRPCTELHLHGSPPLVDEVLQRLGGSDSRSARARARAGGLEERAEAALAEVQTELGAHALVAAAQGLRAALVALAEAPPPERAAGLAALIDASAALAPLFRPLRVVLTGPVNAGKSTLFNALAGEARAIVSPEPGTTRDALGVDVPLGPYGMRLVDTAGEREAPQEASVERAGQGVARALAATADAVLALDRAGVGPQGGGGAAAAPGPATGPAVIRLRTAADLVHGPDPRAWPSDALSAEVAPAHAVARVTERLLAALGLAAAPPWRPGTAVLFDPADLAAARRAAAGDDAARRRWLDLMLGRQPDDPPA